MIAAIRSGQATWHVYLLLADTELKFGCPEEALSHLSNAKSKVKQITNDKEDILIKFEAKALSTTKTQENLKRATQLCKQVCVIDIYMFLEK